MEAFGRAARGNVRVYFVGGTTAVLLERGHRHDLEDVREMTARGLIEPGHALEYFARMEPELYRFPAIDPPSFRRAVEEAFGGGSG